MSESPGLPVVAMRGAWWSRAAGWRTAGVLAALIAVASCTPTPGAVAGVTDEDGHGMQRSIAYRELPTALCAPLDPDAAAALEAGLARVVLSVRNTRPVRRYSDAFVVRARGEGLAESAPLLVFALQPDVVAPAETDRAVAQRFAIDLAGRGIAAAAGARLCFTLSLEHAAGEVQAPVAGDVKAPTAAAGPDDRLELGLRVEAVAD